MWRLFRVTDVSNLDGIAFLNTREGGKSANIVFSGGARAYAGGSINRHFVTGLF